MKVIAAWAVYISGFLGTYGHAFNTIDAKFSEQKAIGAMLCAIAWPLYVSVEAWK